MSDNSWFWFVLFLSAVLAIMARLAIRRTPREKFMKSLGHSLWATALFQMKALKQTINVTTPVFLGFSIPFPKEITSVSQIGILFVAVVYIIFWLWMQRSPATYIEHAFNYGSPEEFTRRRMILTLAFGFFSLLPLYAAWFVYTVLNSAFAWIGIVFLAGLLFQLILIGHLCVIRWWGTSHRRSLGHREIDADDERLL